MTLNYLQSFAVALGISLVATPILSRVALAVGLVNEPSEKKFHVTSMPVLGGTAILISFLTAFIVNRIFQHNSWYVPVLAVSLFMFVFGLFDDVIAVKSRYKILVQAALSIYLSLNGVIFEISNIHFINIFISLIWFLSVVNFFNFVDITDGMASGMAAISSFFFFLLAMLSGNIQIAILCAILCGSCTGFLFFNFHPASIFMGNSGSMFTGTLLACIGMLSSKAGNLSSFIILPVLTGFIFFDSGMVIASRIAARRNILLNSRDHTVHRLNRMGISQTGSLLTSYFFCFFSGCAALLMMYVSVAEASLILMVLIFMVLTSWYMLKDLCDYD